MEGPFNSWCYKCNSYCKPEIRYTYAPVPRNRGEKRAIALQYRATCPHCGITMVPDNKIRLFMSFIRHQLHEKIFADAKQ